MSISFKELNETLQIKQNEMINNRMATNELIIDDMMIELGYNKKKDNLVKRVYNSKIDWEVLGETGNRIAVKVFALGENIESVELSDTIDFCKVKRYSILIVADGDNIQIYRFNKAKLDYGKVCNLNISTELTESQIEILDAISKSGFNMKIVDEALNNKELSESEVKLLMVKNVHSIAKFIAGLKLDNLPDKTCDINSVINIINNINRKDNNEEKDKVELQEKIEQLIKDKEQLENSNKQLEKDKEQLEKDKEQLEKDKEKLEKENNEIGENNKKSDNINNNEITQEEITEYRNQIIDLNNKLAEAEENIHNLKNEIEEKTAIINSMQGIERQRALELLSVIEDNQELDRHYVAVINSELLQFEELSTFIGRTLQKLYEIKNFEASQYIFNGDIFKLVQPAIRNDLMMNNKTFDIDIANQHEDEALNKLRIVFSHFNDVVFECKKIGTIKKEIVVEETNSSVEEFKSTPVSLKKENQDGIEINEDENNLEQQLFDEDIKEESEELVFDTFNSDNTNEIIDETVDENNLEQQLFDNTEELENIQEGFNTEQEDFEEQEEFNSEQEEFDTFSENFDNQVEQFDSIEVGSLTSFEENQDNNIEQLLVGQLLCINELVWSEEPIQFLNIKYVGTNSITFGINTQNGYDNLLCKCIDAVLAIEVYNGNKAIISQVKQTDFSLINKFIKIYVDKYSEYPRINGTRYVIVGIESIQQVASVLFDICKELNLDTSETFLYFTAYTNSDYIIENYGFPEDAVQLSDNTELVYNDEELQREAAIIRGDFFSNIVVTKKSLQCHYNIIEKALAVKTRYLKKALQDMDDVVEVLQQIIEEAYLKEKTLDFNLIGNVIGESYKLISNNMNEVGDNPVEVMTSTETLYCATLQEWQIIHSIIKLHTVLFNDTAIAIKTQINLNALSFYDNDFETSEPSLMLAVKSFTTYLKTCIKK